MCVYWLNDTAENGLVEKSGKQKVRINGCRISLSPRPIVIVINLYTKWTSLEKCGSVVILYVILFCQIFI